MKLERWQGPPHINKVKQYELVLSLVVCVFRHENKDFILFRHEISVIEALSLIKLPSLKLHSAPITLLVSMMFKYIRMSSIIHSDKMSFPEECLTSRTTLQQW